MGRGRDGRVPDRRLPGDNPLARVPRDHPPAERGLERSELHPLDPADAPSPEPQASRRTSLPVQGAGRAKRVALAAALAALALLLTTPLAEARSVPGIDVSRFQGDDRLGHGRAATEIRVRLRAGEPRLGDGLHGAAAPLRARRATTRAITGARRRPGSGSAPTTAPSSAATARPRSSADAKRRGAGVHRARSATLEPGDLRPALDIEKPFDDLNPARAAALDAHLARLGRAAPRRQADHLHQRTSWAALGDPTELRPQRLSTLGGELDVARARGPGRRLGRRTSWRVWQHSSDGNVRRHRGNVDLNWLRGGWRGSRSALRRRDHPELAPPRLKALPCLPLSPLSPAFTLRRRAPLLPLPPPLLPFLPPNASLTVPPSPPTSPPPPPRRAAAQLALAIAASIASPGSSIDLAVAGRRRFGSSARSARAVASAVGRCQVAIVGERKEPVRLGRGGDPAEGRVGVGAEERAVAGSRKARWPGVWPGAANASSDPTRSPGSSVRVGSISAPG